MYDAVVSAAYDARSFYEDKGVIVRSRLAFPGVCRSWEGGCSREHYCLRVVVPAAARVPSRELCSWGEFPREGVPGRYVQGAVALGSLVKACTGIVHVR
jgi:hypothetical protein